MKVKAAPGLRVPTEHNARRYITDEAVDVPRSAYYLRAVADGDLVEIAEEESTADSAPAGIAEAAGTPAKKTR